MSLFYARIYQIQKTQPPAIAVKPDRLTDACIINIIILSVDNIIMQRVERTLCAPSPTALVFYTSIHQYYGCVAYRTRTEANQSKRARVGSICPGAAAVVVVGGAGCTLIAIKGRKIIGLLILRQSGGQSGIYRRSNKNKTVRTYNEIQ